MKKRIISADFETALIGTEYPEPYGYQGLDPLPVCLSYLEHGKEAQIVVGSDMKIFNEWVLDDEVTLVFQNGAFDLGVAIKHLGLPIEKVFRKYNKFKIRDTQIREIMLALATGEAVKNPGKRYDLGSLVRNYLGKDISADKGEDAWRMKYMSLIETPLHDWPDDAVRYPLDDATHTLKVFAHQHKHRAFFEANEAAQTRAAFDLHLISMHSPRVDPERIDIFEANHQAAADKAKAPLIKKGLLKENPNRYKDFPKGDPRRSGYSMDTKLLKRVVQADYTRQGLVVPGTPSGDISTSGDTLKGCQNKILQAYGEAAGDIKMVDAFVPMLRRAAAAHEARVTPRYSVILKTGRTGCSSPNMQQQPKAPGARECFLAEPDQVLAAIDFSSMEMYCLAQTVSQLFGTTKLLDTLNSGNDPHLMAVEDIAGMTYQQMVVKKHEKDPLTLKWRALGKIANFGFAGGMGAATATANLQPYERETVEELFPGEQVVDVMARLQQVWRRKWELIPFFDKAGKLCSGGSRPTYTCPTTGRIKALNSYCQFCNMHFQPIAADALKEAIRIVTESCYTPGLTLNYQGVRLAIEIHDELVLSGPPETVEIWVPVVQAMMKEGAEKFLPDCNIQTEAEICGVRWSKAGVDIDQFIELDRCGQKTSDYLDKRNDNSKLSVEEYLERYHP